MKHSMIFRVPLKSKTAQFILLLISKNSGYKKFYSNVPVSLFVKSFILIIFFSMLNYKNTSKFPQNELFLDFLLCKSALFLTKL